jgi:hypothetical protein
LLRRTNLLGAKHIEARMLLCTYLYRDTKLPTDVNAEDIRIALRIQGCEDEAAEQFRRTL